MHILSFSITIKNVGGGAGQRTRSNITIT